jgi:hypothetical protein
MESKCSFRSETPAIRHDDTDLSPTYHYFKLIRVINIPNSFFYLGLSIKILCVFLMDRLCGLEVRFPGYRSRSSVRFPTLKISEK